MPCTKSPYRGIFVEQACSLLPRRPCQPENLLHPKSVRSGAFCVELDRDPARDIHRQPRSKPKGPDHIICFGHGPGGGRIRRRSPNIASGQRDSCR